MSGFFTIGEKKIRPGIYNRVVDAGYVYETVAGEGYCAAAVQGNWGPLNTPVRVRPSDDFATIIGETSSGYAVLEQMFRGGAEEVVLCRVGTGGTKASLTLQDDDSTPANVVTVTAKYAGTLPLSLTIRASLTDASLKEAILYSGTKILETFTFAAGAAEVDGIVAAMAGSSYVDVAKAAAGTGTLALVAQGSLTGGANPTVTNADYTAALTAIEPQAVQGICVTAVDTNAAAVHALLKAWIDAAYEGGAFVIGVVGEPVSVSAATRVTDAAGYDDEKMVYVYTGWKDADGNIIDGYKAAARIAGMIAATPSNESLTHALITDAADLAESLTNVQIIAAIKAGALAFSKSRAGDVWIEKAITTLLTTTASLDAGWKKIRRTKTRLEMMYRIELSTDGMTGQVTNDANGRAAILAAGQAVLDSMVGEGKLISGATMELDPMNPPTADSAWFIIAADDLDSFETGYMTYNFRFQATE